MLKHRAKTASLFIALCLPFSIFANQPEDNNNSSPFLTAIVKFSAHITIPVGEIIASDVASQELSLFRTGEHDGSPVVFNHESEASKELLEGRYYQELTDFLMTATARWYGNEIPASGALYSHYDTFRVFNGSDALHAIVDGIDMADIVGTITYYVRITSKNGKLTFTATNVMSLGSYAGENYFQYDKVEDPVSGSFKSRVQVFQWQQDIPEKYLKP